jgi:hypothetical protein
MRLKGQKSEAEAGGHGVLKTSFPPAKRAETAL